LGGGNPFDGESAFDPDSAFSPTSGSPLHKMQDGYDTYQTLVTDLDEETDWDSILTKAVAEIDTNLDWADINTAIAAIVTSALSTGASAASGAASAAASAINNAAILTAITAFESSRLPTHLRAISRLSAGYADINSVAGSAYVWAMAAAEFEFSKEVSDFGAKLNLEAYNNSFRVYVEAFVGKLRNHMASRTSFDTLRMNSITQSVGDMLQQLRLKVQGQRDGTSLQAEISRISLVALKEQADKNLDIDVSSNRWDMNIITQGANVMGSLSGAAAAVIGPQPSPVQSALGGAMSGAAAGAMIGSVIPGGAIAGAIIGGIGGFLMGLF
ncbi:hypothetical protein LCGC14_2431460, partial [marine sediment metagenome]